MGRHANGEGTIYRRKDGRYEAAAYLLTTSGNRKRVRVYGKTRHEVHDKLTKVKARADDGVPIPDHKTKLADYLDYWLEAMVRPNRRPRTYELYEATVRLNLKPRLGQHSLSRLSVPVVQAFFNQELQSHSVRKVQIMRTVLSSALTRANREELVSRNVARLVELPTSERAEIQPWSIHEVKQFLDAAQPHQYCPAYVLLTFYGLRRGEVLGLRWCDIDFEHGILRIRQQLQRYGGALQQAPVKTSAGRRDLGMLDIVRDILLAYRARQAATLAATAPGYQGNGLVFTSANGNPIEPGNLVRAFHQLCARHGIRRIKLHHLRHTTATLLKNLRVPDRDIQAILGHSQISVTQQLYEHGDVGVQRDALVQAASVLFPQQAPEKTNAFWRSLGHRCRQALPSLGDFVVFFSTAISGGPGGTRTHDTLLKSSIHDPPHSRITEVNRLFDVSRKAWLLGLVAVSVAVKIDGPLG
ncbi:MAG TPA: site-specific integrase [Sphingomicrobium sp.]|nr:site-specific integrase [Sphingomicrobium sp.]